MRNSTTLKTLAIMAFLSLSANTQAEDRDTTVTIPASGHLAFKSSRNFTGPSSIIVSNFYGSGNATSKGFVFQNQTLGEDVVIAVSANSSTGLILTAQPGTYTLTLTDRAATKQFFSTNVSWTDQPGTVYKEKSAIYKFINTPGQVGFQRDEQYAAEGYQHCDLAEGEHIYFAVSEKAMARITDTMQTTAAELAFIPWSKDLWGCPVVENATGIENAITDPQHSTLTPQRSTFTLAGQQVSASLPGIIIKNGNKYLKK